MKRFPTRIVLLATLSIAFAMASFAADKPQSPTLTQRAAQALFEQNDSALALRLASDALAKDKKNLDAAFVKMEAADLRADDTAVLEAALAICTQTDENDPRAEIAASRVEKLAANSTIFRAQLARVQKAAKTNSALRLALVAAAQDGVPELDQLASSREAGLVTDWRVAGPFGRHSLVDFDKHFSPEKDELRRKITGGKQVELFQFTQGKFMLPDYFPRTGVYYAAGDVYTESEGDFNVYLDTQGTSELYIDGARVLRRDDRAGASASVMRTTLHLLHGTHRVLIKFVPAASPFRVALLPPNGGLHRKQNIPVLTATPESEYIMASLQYWRGDYASAVALASKASVSPASAAFQMLIGNAWSHLSEQSSEEQSAMELASARDAGAARALLTLAELRFRSDRTEDGLRLLKAAHAIAPENEATLRAEANEFAHLGWTRETLEAQAALVKLHPSCSVLSSAADTFATADDLGRSTELTNQLAHCAPESLAFAQALSRRGEHVRASQEAQKVAKDFPLNRDALELAARELMLVGDTTAATPMAQSLAKMAPNASSYAALASAAQRGLPMPSDDSRRAPVELLANFRRDARETIKDMDSRKFSGGPAVWTLNDSAVVEANGSKWVYTHRIVRLLNRDGVLNYGEIAVPENAQLLTLRTIKADGRMVEPELHQHKSTVTMAALAPGDNIEIEYIARADGDTTTFEFGSFDAPILLSRFTLIAPAGVQARGDADGPKPSSAKMQNGLVATAWERNDIPQSSREPALVPATLFPSVRVDGEFHDLAEYREHLQDELLAASAPGARSARLTAELRAKDAVATARNLYHFVVRNIDESDADGAMAEIASAEDSIGSGAGSRVAALLALGRAAGLDVEAALVRETGSNDRVDSYSHPVVIFRFADGRSLLADTSNDALPLGAVDPGVDVAHALAVMRFNGPEFAMLSDAVGPLPPATAEERSVADAVVNIDSTGTLQAGVTITMGAWRGAQMRELLRGINGADRQRFFQQLAMRLFPGATNATGVSENEADAEQPLVLKVSCQAPGFVDMQRRVVDVDQITPALGLRSMYVRSATRKFPMKVDALLFETAVFRVHLPQGVTLTSGLQTHLDGPYGTYTASVRQTANRTWEMRREFNIPMQVITPERYAEFSAFATQIERIERQRLSLRIDTTQTTQQSARVQ